MLWKSSCFHPVQMLLFANIHSQWKTRLHLLRFPKHYQFLLKELLSWNSSGSLIKAYRESASAPHALCCASLPAWLLSSSSCHQPSFSATVSSTKLPPKQLPSLHLQIWFRSLCCLKCTLFAAVPSTPS